MCCSPVDGHGVRRKLKASVVKKFGSEANVVGIRMERRKKIFKPTGKGDKWTINRALEEKIEKRKNGVTFQVFRNTSQGAHASGVSVCMFEI